MKTPEDEVVAWFEQQGRLAAERFPIGIGDDMAQVRLSEDASVLVTTDMLLDGVHFDLKTITLEQAGYKAMAVSLSDCAAMATVPLAAVVSVALPEGFGDAELKQLHPGIVRAGRAFDCELIGGDITSWRGNQPFAISVAMLSRPGTTPPVTRGGAQVGDLFCVTGSLGGSLGGRHLSFDPRVREALRLCEIADVHAMIDLSDGLSCDLPRICARSGVGAVIDAARIPISPEAAKANDSLSAALHDGEDFELLFAVSPADQEQLVEKWDQAVSITTIGTATEGRRVRIQLADGTVVPLEAGGYDHLRRRT